MLPPAAPLWVITRKTINSQLFCQSFLISSENATIDWKCEAESGHNSGVTSSLDHISYQRKSLLL